VIGSAFIELGYEPVAQAIVESFSEQIDIASGPGSDHKSQLQEYAQRHGDTVSYELVDATGPDHERTFTMEASFDAIDRSARGVGRTKKAAEQEAASRLLQQVGGLSNERDARVTAPSDEGRV
jgi:ribonuclease-3